VKFLKRHFVSALAEAGVVLSKLSSKYNSDDGDVYFYPERFVESMTKIDSHIVLMISKESSYLLSTALTTLIIIDADLYLGVI